MSQEISYHDVTASLRSQRLRRDEVRDFDGASLEEGDEAADPLPARHPAAPRLPHELVQLRPVHVPLLQTQHHLEIFEEVRNTVSAQAKMLCKGKVFSGS